MRAVLDWELAHLGDPAEDFGWITVNSWRFGAIDKPVGGFGSVEEMLEGYRSEGGEAIDAERVLYWRTFGSLRWGLICRSMAPRRHGRQRRSRRAGDDRPPHFRNRARSPGHSGSAGCAMSTHPPAGRVLASVVAFSAR